MLNFKPPIKKMKQAKLSFELSSGTTLDKGVKLKLS